MKAILESWADLSHPVIGMVHLLPLPGSPGFSGEIKAVIDAAVADAKTWAQAGANGLMMENFGDVPFFKGDVPRETVAAMTKVASEIRAAVPGLPLGIRSSTRRRSANRDMLVALCNSSCQSNPPAPASITSRPVQPSSRALWRMRSQLSWTRRASSPLTR